MTTQTQGVLNAVVVAILVLFGVFVTKSYFKKLSAGCCGTGGNGPVKKKKVHDKKKEHYPYTSVLSIDGIVCGKCAISIENALNALDGVWASVDVNQKCATVRMKHCLAPQLLRSTVNDIGGYTVMKIEEM